MSMRNDDKHVDLRYSDKIKYKMKSSPRAKEDWRLIDAGSSLNSAATLKRIIKRC